MCFLFLLYLTLSFFFLEFVYYKFWISFLSRYLWHKLIFQIPVRSCFLNFSMRMNPCHPLLHRNLLWALDVIKRGGLEASLCNLMGLLWSSSLSHVNFPSNLAQTVEDIFSSLPLSLSLTPLNDALSFLLGSS